MFSRGGRWVGVLSLLARLGLAAVWLVSGSIKVSDLTRTRVAVRAYRLFSTSVADLIGVMLPFLELALGVLLLIGLGVRVVAAVSALVLLVFIAGVISAAARGLTIDCGCFGGGGQVGAGQTAYTAEILRDVGFLLLAGYLMIRPESAVSIDRWVLHRVSDPA